MHITIITASTSQQSNSAYLASQFEDVLRRHGTTVNVFHLKDIHLEQFAVKHYDSSYQHEEEFVRIQQAIEQSDGIVIATPVWNFGVPGQLKNLIDRMGSFALDRETSKGLLNGKPLFCIFTGGAPLPAWEGMMKKTTSFIPEGLRYFGATPVGTFFEGKCTKGRGQFGLVVDQRPETIERIEKEAENFSAIVKRYSETGALPLQQSLWGKMMKMGEKVLKKVT